MAACRGCGLCCSSGWKLLKHSRSTGEEDISPEFADPVAETSGSESYNQAHEYGFDLDPPRSLAMGRGISPTRYSET